MILVCPALQTDLNKECFKQSGVMCTCDFVLWLLVLEVLFSIIVIRNGKWRKMSAKFMSTIYGWIFWPSSQVDPLVLRKCPMSWTTTLVRWSNRWECTTTPKCHWNNPDSGRFSGKKWRWESQKRRSMCWRDVFFLFCNFSRRLKKVTALHSRVLQGTTIQSSGAISHQKNISVIFNPFQSKIPHFFQLFFYILNMLEFGCGNLLPFLDPLSCWCGSNMFFPSLWRMRKLSSESSTALSLPF